jgi:hypothetical protein
MELNLVLRGIALIGSLIVGITALVVLRAEWRKTALEDHVTKVMMVLLTVGCVEVVLVALGKLGRT